MNRIPMIYTYDVRWESIAQNPTMKNQIEALLLDEGGYWLHPLVFKQGDKEMQSLLIHALKFKSGWTWYNRPNFENYFIANPVQIKNRDNMIEWLQDKQLSKLNPETGPTTFIESPSVHQQAPIELGFKMIDLRDATNIEINFEQDTGRLWINIDGRCAVRIQMVTNQIELGMHGHTATYRNVSHD